MKYLTLTMVLICWAVCARATIYPEVEPNDTFASADAQGTRSYGYGDGVTGAIGLVGDRDLFAFNPTFSAAYLSLTTTLTITVYNSSGTQLGSGTGTTYQLPTLTPGSLYYFGINAPGNNTAIPSYTAVFTSTVPEPATWALLTLAAGSLLFLRRRRLQGTSAR